MFLEMRICMGLKSGTKEKGIYGGERLNLLKFGGKKTNENLNESF